MRHDCVDFEKKSLIKSLSERWFTPQAVKTIGAPSLKPGSRAQKVVIEARKIRKQGRPEEAMSLLRGCFFERAGLPVLLEYWQQACMNQLSEDKVFSGRALVRTYVMDKDPISAHFYWRQLQERGLLEQAALEADLILQLVELLGSAHLYDEADDVLIAHAELHGFDDLPGAATRVCEVLPGLCESLLQKVDLELLCENDRAQLLELVATYELDIALFHRDKGETETTICELIEPIQLGELSFHVKRADGKRETIRYSAVEGVYLAAVGQKEERPYLVIDLVAPLDAVHNRILRISTRRFNPQQVMPHAVDAYAAYLKIAERFLNESKRAVRPNTVVDLGLLPVCFESEVEMECEFYGHAVA